VFTQEGIGTRNKKFPNTAEAIRQSPIQKEVWSLKRPITDWKYDKK
jgi:hypothetical protein